MEGRTKDGDGKAPISIIPSDALTQIAWAMEHGAEKYGRGDYRFQDHLKWTLYVDACYRHLGEFLEGRHLDKESGLHHVGHAAASLCILLYLVTNGRGHDDREL